MSKLKTLLFLIIGLSIFSCKKTQDEKIVSFDEMKQITSQSEELNSIFKINQELISYERANVINKLSRNSNIKSLSSNVTLANTNQIEMPKIATEESLKKVINEINPQNGNLIFEKLKLQQALFKKFIENNPSFMQFNKSQRIELLTNASIMFSDNVVNKSLNLFENPLSLKEFRSDCMGAFNLSFNSCENTYNNTVVTAFAIVVTTSLGGPVTALIGDTVALEQVVGAYFAFKSCIESAANQLNVC